MKIPPTCPVIIGSLRLNLTQHGETHQVNLQRSLLLSGPGIVIDFASIRHMSTWEMPPDSDVERRSDRRCLVRHQLEQGTPKHFLLVNVADPVASSGCSEPLQRAESGGLLPAILLAGDGLRYVLILREIAALSSRSE